MYFNQIKLLFKKIMCLVFKGSFPMHIPYFEAEILMRQNNNNFPPQQIISSYEFKDIHLILFVTDFRFYSKVLWNFSI